MACALYLPCLSTLHTLPLFLWVRDAGFLANSIFYYTVKRCSSGGLHTPPPIHINTAVLQLFILIYRPKKKRVAAVHMTVEICCGLSGMCVVSLSFHTCVSALLMQIFPVVPLCIFTSTYTKEIFIEKTSVW